MYGFDESIQGRGGNRLSGKMEHYSQATSLEEKLFNIFAEAFNKGMDDLNKIFESIDDNDDMLDEEKEEAKKDVKKEKENLKKAHNDIKKDIKKVLKENTSEKNKKIKETMSKTLREKLKLASAIFERSQKYVPVDEGDLKLSGKMIAFENGFLISYRSAKQVDGKTVKDYSRYVHEIPYYNHKAPTRYKYLEDAAFEVAAEFSNEGIEYPISMIYYPNMMCMVGVKKDNSLKDLATPINKIAENRINNADKINKLKDIIVDPSALKKMASMGEKKANEYLSLFYYVNWWGIEKNKDIDLILKTWLKDISAHKIGTKAQTRTRKNVFYDINPLIGMEKYKSAKEDLGEIADALEGLKEKGKLREQLYGVGLTVNEKRDFYKNLYRKGDPSVEHDGVELDWDDILEDLLDVPPVVPMQDK